MKSAHRREKGRIRRQMLRARNYYSLKRGNRKMRKVGWNDQRNNDDFKGQFKASCQCFSTSVWMLMSYFSRAIRADDDKGLKMYVDDVSNVVGSAGIGEIIMRKLPFIKGNSAYWWQVHKAAIEKWLKQVGVNAVVTFRDGDCTMSEIEFALKYSPVVLGTDKMAGLPGGHIILVVDRDDRNWYVNDPFGNANTRYTDKNGAMVAYPIDWLKQYITYNKGGLCRAMWIEKAF